MDKKDLERKLEHIRQRMIRSGVENGLQNPKTIRLSKQLDRIMNQYKQNEESSKINEENKSVF